ncbi:Clp protease N-terminal domain-containing protein, partial [Burkholderia pseudomallei]
MSTPLKTLIAKLNPVCRKAAERAASHCFARGHYEVDLEHLFLALLDESTGDVPLVLRASGVDPHALRADLERELERLKTGNTRTPVFSVHLSELFEQAWLIASLDSQIGRIRSGHLLLALLTGPDLAQFAQRMSSQFARVRVDDLKHKFDEIAAGSSEAEPRHADADVAVPDGAAASGDAPRGPSKTPALDTYTTNLTQRAREGKIDPVIGRDAEIRQAIDILMRRRQNNPIMTGEAGVGKTA